MCELKLKGVAKKNFSGGSADVRFMTMPEIENCYLDLSSKNKFKW